jgi:hypothetical protein
MKIWRRHHEKVNELAASSPKPHSPLLWAWLLACTTFWVFALGWDIRQGEVVSCLIDGAFIGIVWGVVDVRLARERAYEAKQSHRNQINGGA